jgi:outer membrane receptor protein involved in Fe transport
LRGGRRRSDRRPAPFEHRHCAYKGAARKRLGFFPDDGSVEFKGPSRGYGYEPKMSLELTRMRAIDHYRLDGSDAAIVAAGHTVLDLGVARRLTRMVELNLSIDNLMNRNYWETQNYFASRVTPEAPIVSRIHATPAYPLTAVAGLTFRFGSK